jgi:TRAP-type C4-dicarboxylate transport system permease small subunit
LKSLFNPIVGGTELIILVIFVTIVIVYSIVEMISSYKEMYPSVDAARLFSFLAIFIFCTIALILFLTGFWWVPPF